ncbi:hypothetical protein QJS10_CPB20g00248 [Acorus calamus]|uniref:MSP domain-containing protein n=1 Tax=Acorus calamus TaxID=4465 RepID=A0AAV9CED9_ACOCL|nr:hypothetical protein QJS10_CPB20g00248 [Acorus calamus]
MEKLVEVSDQEICIDFKLNTKCRAKVTLKSLHPTSPISFKVQTSAPHKFLVSPPTGLLPPLSAASFHVILKPQPSVPHSFPRSPSDRFLIKTAIAAAANSTSTYDVKLRVVYVGLTLLRHAISSGNAEAVRDLLRRQRSLVSDLVRDEAAELVGAAGNRKDVLDALFEAGLRRPRGKVPHGEGGSNGWSAVHVAAAEDRRDAMAKLIERLRGGELDARDREGRTAVHVAAGKGHVQMVRMLVEGGADKDARSGDGRTALHRAAANGDRDMVVALLEMGADCEIPTVRGQTPLDVARDKGHRVVVEMLGRGEMMLTAARRGDVKLLEVIAAQRRLWRRNEREGPVRDDRAPHGGHQGPPRRGAHAHRLRRGPPRARQGGAHPAPPGRRERKRGRRGGTRRQGRGRQRAYREGRDPALHGAVDGTRSDRAASPCERRRFVVLAFLAIVVVPVNLCNTKLGLCNPRMCCQFE